MRYMLAMNDYPADTRRASQEVREFFIEADTILRYLIGSDDDLDTLILCNPKRQRFVTTDQEVYHALGSVKNYDDFKLNKLAKFFETVAIKSVERKHLLTEPVVENLRAEALRK